MARTTDASKRRASLYAAVPEDAVCRVLSGLFLSIELQVRWLAVDKKSGTDFESSILSQTRNN